jgi:hypothetical protein
MNAIEMLEHATCSNHKHVGYEYTCASCVWRYMYFLIQQEYTPNYKVEDERRTHNAQMASLRSDIATLTFALDRCHE